ncbi:MAG: LuxR C-terminal-related transcriptional regulator [Isosphaeraceae bacterium]
MPCSGKRSRDINKNQATDKDVEGIRQVLDGKVYMSDVMIQTMLQRTVGPGATRGRAFAALADRDSEVFRLIDQGVKTAEIDERLQLSVKTIETYRDRIRAKLDLTDGTALAHNATKWMQENL